MRKAQKKQAEDFILLLDQAHEEIGQMIGKGQVEAALELLGQCQEGAVKLGEMIENAEGGDFPAILALENYCELVYEIYEGLIRNREANGNKIYKRLRKALIRVENSVRNDIRVRYEIVFMPYKASMWDSLESVWQAAAADPDCDVYVVPIPYYDRNRDRSLGAFHYEGKEFPAEVPVTHYDAYSLEERKPDAVYIHNPYDNMNFVTSVDPRFYSKEIKKYTECLVYIPYYSTAGGMAEGQASCPAYDNADYIVIQAEKYKKFFDSAIPDSKFLVMGSPKFDSIIHKCQNPPKPPAEWEDRMEGRKVYFYNTSIGGMLGNTDAFLKKMRYVFDTFRGREDACLVWRPHPLLESSFESMRKGFKPQFDALREEFINENIGIYDDTPDMERTIAYSDAYIGDSGTSVTSLFGVVGKPLFIFNNNIHTLPEKDDWRGERIRARLNAWGDDRYHITGNNQLWFSEKNDYRYEFYMDLGTGYSDGGYYIGAVEIKDEIYVFPGNAQHLLIIKDKKIRKINFKEPIVRPGAFFSYWYNEKYIFLFPCQYPYLVRFNIDTEEIRYVEGIKQFSVRIVEGEQCIGGVGLYENELVFASPADDQFLFMNIDTFRTRSLKSNSGSNFGTQGIVTEGENLWLMPLNGMALTCWNPRTGDVREYSDVPQGFRSVKPPYGYECRQRPFGAVAFSKDSGKENIVISPTWGNMYLSLDRETGKMEEWKPPMRFQRRGRNGYFTSGSMGGFMITYPQIGKADCRIWDDPDRKLYDINIDTKEYKEVRIEFNYDELIEHEPGFMEESEWMQYCLNENAFNSLKDFLDGNITGNFFDRERQIRAFSKINANTDGTCGKNVHEFVKGKIL